MRAFKHPIESRFQLGFLHSSVSQGEWPCLITEGDNLAELLNRAAVLYVLSFKGNGSLPSFGRVLALLDGFGHLDAHNP